MIISIDGLGMVDVENLHQFDNELSDNTRLSAIYSALNTALFVYYANENIAVKIEKYLEYLKKIFKKNNKKPRIKRT